MKDANRIYRRQNGGYVLIRISVLGVFNRFIQYPGKTEAGGILLGSYRDNHIEVVSATPPSPKDIRRPLRYIRRCPSHKTYAFGEWKRSNHLVTYIGEWHTHPENVPTPSSIDYDNWEKLLPRNDLVLCIQGLSDLWVGETTEYQNIVTSLKKIEK